MANFLIGGGGWSRRSLNIDRAICDRCRWSIDVRRPLANDVVYGFICPECFTVERFVVRSGVVKRDVPRQKVMWLNHAFTCAMSSEVHKQIEALDAPFIEAERRERAREAERALRKSKQLRERTRAERNIRAFKRHIGLIGSKKNAKRVDVSAPDAVGETTERTSEIYLKHLKKRRESAERARVAAREAKMRMHRFLVRANRKAFGDIVPKEKRRELRHEVLEVFLAAAELRGHETGVEGILLREYHDPVIAGHS